MTGFLKKGGCKRFIGIHLCASHPKTTFYGQCRVSSSVFCALIVALSKRTNVDLKGRAFHLSSDITQDKERHTVPKPDIVHAELE